jgi:RNA polymerase sigma-70 factor, ECF subfamily
MESDDSRLVARAKEGAPDAVAELFRRHWPSVWLAAYAVCGRREAADDVAQEAFVRGMSALETFDDRRPLRPWLARIAVNAAIDELRRENRLAPSENSQGAATLEVDWPGDDEIVRAVARLAPEKRLIVALHYWLDYETPEIAELLNVPLGTVASRLSRALSELRMDLEAEHV